MSEEAPKDDDDTKEAKEMKRIVCFMAALVTFELAWFLLAMPSGVPVSLGKPKVISAVSFRGPCGGTYQKLSLACGHVVTRLRRRDLRFTAPRFAECPECRKSHG